MIHTERKGLPAGFGILIWAMVIIDLGTGFLLWSTDIRNFPSLLLTILGHTPGGIYTYSSIYYVLAVWLCTSYYTGYLLDTALWIYAGYALFWTALIAIIYIQFHVSAVSLCYYGAPIAMAGSAIATLRQSRRLRGVT